jgi:hypothetical protein
LCHCAARKVEKIADTGVKFSTINLPHFGMIFELCNKAVSNSNYGYLNAVQSGGTFRFLIGAYGPADQQNWKLNVTYPSN